MGAERYLFGMRRRSNLIEYTIGTSDQVLVFSDEVLAHFKRNRQTRWWAREAGGQLFAKIQDQVVTVVSATGPRRSDKRSRTRYFPSRRDEQIEICEAHAQGLHYVGDWHTHPQSAPTLSSVDVDSMRECVAKSLHGLNGFVLIVVGTAPPPTGFCVCICDDNDCYRLAAREHSTETSN